MPNIRRWIFKVSLLYIFFNIYILRLWDSRTFKLIYELSSKPYALLHCDIDGQSNSCITSSAGSHFDGNEIMVCLNNFR